MSISRKYAVDPGHPGQAPNPLPDNGLAGPGATVQAGTDPGQNVTPALPEVYGREHPDRSKRRPARSKLDQPAVICAGATGRLVRVKTVAVELGLTENRARLLMGRLGVVIRTLGDQDYVHLFALELALWRWFGLSDDVRLVEFAYRAYRDLERRGVERVLQRLCGKRLGRRLRERTLSWEAIRAWWKANRRSNGGRPPSLETGARAAGVEPGGRAWDDPAIGPVGPCLDDSCAL